LTLKAERRHGERLEHSAEGLAFDIQQKAEEATRGKIRNSRWSGRSIRQDHIWTRTRKWPPPILRPDTAEPAKLHGVDEA
jgi:hypothetical protein